MASVHRPSAQVDRRGSMATHGRHRPRRIILHDTESAGRPGYGDITGIFDFWRRQGLGYGAHVVIDPDGYSGIGADADQIVWATQGANTGSLQIEIIGLASFKATDWLRPSRRKQLNKVAMWLAYWGKTYGIPLRLSTSAGVARHLDFPAGGHHDPGTGFPLGWVLRRARMYQAKGW